MYFARLNIFYKVLQVIVADQNFVDRQPGMWVPCDINGVEPKNFPGIGYTFDLDRMAFIAPKPYPSWILNEETCKWEAPSPMPDNGLNHLWDEQSQIWIELE